MSEADSGEKEVHARALLLALAPRLGGEVQLMRVPGRLYPGEAAARFCFGALFERHAEPRAGSAFDADFESLRDAPQVDEAAGWLTITPDPAVVEVNMAPAHDLVTFARWLEDIYAAAAEVRLSPTRFRYNGELTDSGGGGQITFGGPSPVQSPFFLRPQLLPSMLRYFNRHPALSYLFASACCGSGSQGPRPDEGVRERFDELPVALDYLSARGDSATPTELWSMLAPLLVDATGSTHRAELNIEKLWNPWFAGRGQLGLVELRALRMPATPARLTAVAALYRSIVARLAAQPYHEPLLDWGSRLHDTYGLPWYLERDLEAVLEDLETYGFGLGPLLRAELRARPEPLAILQLGEATLELRPAVNFWPLLGDLSSQEQHGARLVDASTTRLELLIRSPRAGTLGLVAANGFRVPLLPITGPATERGIGSVIYRTFAPQIGLHPALAVNDPLLIEWQRDGACIRAELHAWKPGGGPYAGLPADDAEARARREARVVITSGPRGEHRPSQVSGMALDLRRQSPAPR